MEAVDQMRSKETHKRITTQLHRFTFFFGVGGTLIRTTKRFLSSSVGEHSAQSVGRSSLKGAAAGLQQVIFKSFHMYVDPLAQISTAYLAIQSPAFPRSCGFSIPGMCHLIIKSGGLKDIFKNTFPPQKAVLISAWRGRWARLKDFTHKSNMCNLILFVWNGTWLKL